MSYESRIQKQIAQFQNLDTLKKLPPVYQYWTQKYIVPILTEVFGVRNAVSLYATQFAQAIARQPRTRRILSIGAGDCQLEIAIAKHLRQREVEGFIIDCTDLSGLRLERGQDLARQEGVSDFLDFLEVDLNTWLTTRTYAGVIAHHTLHHIMELETLFARLLDRLDDQGVFVSIDMIGRNGHLRWPETLAWMNKIWAFLPDRYKFNHQFEKLIDPYLNWDCSTRSFEGIRAQDILPLLRTSFSFTHFFAIGGLIDIFVERGYGHNYDINSKTDLGLIDFIHELNVTLIDHDIVKPTMMFAVMQKKSTPIKTIYYKHWSPEFCVRDPAR